MALWLTVPCDYLKPERKDQYHLYWSEQSQFGQLYPGRPHAVSKISTTWPNAAVGLQSSSQEIRHRTRVGHQTARSGLTATFRKH